jgi:hypothetical protein
MGVTNQRVGVAGGNLVTESQLEGGREAISDLPSMDSNRERCADSLEERNERKILQTILGREIGESKVAETRQMQGQNRGCDFMELMHSEDQVAKDDCPSVAEGDTDKVAEENQGEDHMVGPEQDGPNIGPGGWSLDAPSHVIGPELLTEPQMDPPFLSSEENKNERNLSGEGSTCKWRRRTRAPTTVQEPLKVGKRNFEEAALTVGADLIEQVKKGRAHVEEVSNMVWAKDGHQPRRSQ